jgi:MFS family permease
MKKNWFKIRKIGKRNFIILSSLLLGLLAAAFSSIVHMVIDNHYDFSLFYSGGSLGMFVGGTLGGLLFSYSQWEINENKFKKQNDGQV